MADGITCDVPQPMVDEQAKRFVDNLKMQLQSQGIPYEQYLKLTNSTEEDMLGQAQEPALRQVKLDLALEAIAKAENVEVTDEEIEAEYERSAEQYGMKAEDLKKYISSDNIKSQLVNTKVVKIVVDSAVATKPVEKTEEKAEGEEKPKAKKSAKKAETAEGEEKPKAKRTAKKAEEKAEGEEKPKAKRTAKKAEEKTEEKSEE